MGFGTAIGCKACGKSIPAGTAICPHCGRSQADPNQVQAATSQTPISIEQRRSILQQQIAHYSSAGYRVQNQTDSTAQMVRPKQFSAGIAILSFFLFGVGLLIYLFIYMAQKDSTVFLQVDEFGGLRAT